MAAKCRRCFLSSILLHLRDVAGFCLSLSSMNLSVFWYAASGHYVYIDCSVMLCFAGRDQTEPALAFMCTQTKQACLQFHFGIQSQYLALLNQWILNGWIFAEGSCVPAQGLRWLFSDAGTKCDSVYCISSHFSTNHYVFTVLYILKSYSVLYCCWL